MSDERKTVRVRLRLRVSDVGDWHGFGWPRMSEDESLAEMDGAAMQGDSFRDVWVEADVPLPEPLETVEGEVRDA